MIVYLNGKYLNEKKAFLSIHDHGFLYGDGVYETLRVYDGRVFLLEEHLKRLKHSLEGIQLKPPTTLKAIGRAIHKTAQVNGHREAVVRLTISRGPGAYGFDPKLCDQPTIAIVSRPFTPYPPSYHADGITLAIVSIRRNSPRSLPPHVKSISCVNGVLAKMESLKLGAHEGAMLTLDDHVSEGTVSNIFAYKNRVLTTPALDGTLLAGTTRGFVISFAKKAGYVVFERRMTLKDLTTADEVFLTNTTMEVLPVTRLIDNTGPTALKVKAGDGTVGPVTQHLMRLFKGNAKLPGYEIQ